MKSALNDTFAQPFDPSAFRSNIMKSAQQWNNTFHVTLPGIDKMSEKTTIPETGWASQMRALKLGGDHSWGL